MLARPVSGVTSAMEVLVSGGSGFIGRAVVAALRQEGHRVRVLSRGTVPTPSGVSWARGSILEPNRLPAACRGCDAVLHLVGIIAEVGPQTYERVHVDGTRNLLAAARSEGVSRWVQMSALGTRVGALARYHRTKWEAEEMVRDSGLRWTVHRPSIVFGPGDGFVNFFERMSRWSPVLPLIGGGRMQFQPIAVEDVARSFAGALSRPATEGQTYDLCGNERFTFRQLLAEILRVTGRTRVLLPVPWALARVQAALAEWVVGRMLGRPPPMSRDALLMLRDDNVGDPGPMKRAFEFEPMGFQEGIRRYLPAGPEQKSGARPSECR